MMDADHKKVLDDFKAHGYTEKGLPLRIGWDTSKDPKVPKYIIVGDGDIHITLKANEKTDIQTKYPTAEIIEQ